MSVESQLWLNDGKGDKSAADKDASTNRGVLGQNNKGATAASGKYSPMSKGPHVDATSALTGLATIMGQYCERRDVVRASCRLLVNLSVYPGVVDALNKMGIIEKVRHTLS